MAELSAPVAVPGIGEVVVLGDVFCDVVLRGVPRLPDWGEEVFGAEPVLCPGGVANVAVGLARLGLPTRMLARTRARDTIGQVLAEELAQHANLTVTWLGSAPSTAITVALPHGSERAMISYVPPAGGRTLAPQIPWEILPRATHLHLAAWSEGPTPLEDQTRILAEARRRD